MNKDNKEMYFSIGGHPAFVCGENAIGAQVRFETKENGIQYHCYQRMDLYSQISTICQSLIKCDIDREFL